MSTAQRIIKYCAIALAFLIIVSIVSFAASCLGIVSSFFGDDTAQEEMKLLSIDNAESIKSIEIEVAAAHLLIIEGDKFQLETNNKYISTHVSNAGELQIKEKSHFGFGNKLSSEVILYIPKGFVFSEADLTTGAGNVEIDVLITNTLHFEAGAGKLLAENIVVSNRAEIEGGAGDIEITYGKINSLDLEMGVGNASLSLELGESSSAIEMGIGKLDLTLIGNEESYSVRPSKGIGSIRIDGLVSNANGFFGNGNRIVNVESGIGSINIDFK